MSVSLSIALNEEKRSYFVSMSSTETSYGQSPAPRDFSPADVSRPNSQIFTLKLRLFNARLATSVLDSFLSRAYLYMMFSPWKTT